MSENQQPLTEEQASEAQAASAAEEETAQTAQPAAAAEPLPADETDDDVQADAEDDGEVEDEEEEFDIDPADVRILGMPRVCFHFGAGGVALGYIVCGLVGILADKTAGTPIGDLAAKSPDAWIWVIAFAAVGYLIGKQKHKKRMAALEAEEAARAEEADGVSPETEHPEA